MTKLKIEHGASRVCWVLLKTTIEESIASDIDLMCQWSENDRRYIVNQLLRFALEQSMDFQQYKSASRTASSASGTGFRQVVATMNASAETVHTADITSTPGVSKESSL